MDGWTAANRAALGGLCAALLLVVLAAAGARRTDPPAAAPAPRDPPPLPQVQARAPASGPSAILRAVSRDPFRADRRRPPGRYRPPGAEPAFAAAAPPPASYAYEAPPAAPPLRLTGTVILQNGRGLAALAGASGDSRVLRVGEEMDGFRVVRVTSGSATLSNGDTTLVLQTREGTP